MLTNEDMKTRQSYLNFYIEMRKMYLKKIPRDFMAERRLLVYKSALKSYFRYPNKYTYNTLYGVLFIV